MQTIKKIIFLLSIFVVSGACAANQPTLVGLVCNLKDHKQTPSVEELWLNESDSTVSFWNPEAKFPAVFTASIITSGYVLKRNNINVTYEINRQSGNINVYLTDEKNSGRNLYQSGSCSLASESSRKF